MRAAEPTSQIRHDLGAEIVDQRTIRLAIAGLGLRHPARAPRSAPIILPRSLRLQCEHLVNSSASAVHRLCHRRIHMSGGAAGTGAAHCSALCRHVSRRSRRGLRAISDAVAGAASTPPTNETCYGSSVEPSREQSVTHLGARSRGSVRFAGTVGDTRQQAHHSNGRVTFVGVLAN
jgi:hypothetical protein